MLKFLRRFALGGAKPVAAPAPARPSSAANLWRRLTGPSPDPTPPDATRPVPLGVGDRGASPTAYR